MYNNALKTALLPLPLVGVKALISTNQSVALRSLADNPSLKNEELLQILDKKDLIASQQALTKISDQDILIYNLKKYQNRRKAILRNPSLSVEIINSYINDPDPAVRLSIYLNPATPLELKKEHITPSEVSKCVEVGGFLGASVVRASELFLSNTWMLETPGKWPQLIRRAIATSPYLNKEINEELRKAGWANWSNYRNHPYLQGRYIHTLTTKELLSFASAATDLLLLEKEDLTTENAREIVTREKPAAEPYILSRLVQRFGHAVIAKPNNLAGTRIKSASWLNPSIAISATTQKTELDELSHALSLLSDSESNWENFITLSKNWSSSLTSLALAAKRL
ncbi:MAG: hypothetical protein ACKOW9_02210 [Candidatus Paceibacterota bacterium]